MDVLWSIIGVIGILVGVIGIFAPILPGIPVAWAGVFIYAIGTGWEKMGIWTVVGLGIAMAVILALDLLAPALGAKKYKASKWGMLGAVIGGIVGVIVLNVWGIVLGPILGAFIAEFIVQRDSGIAMKSALGAFIGFMAGVLVKLVYMVVLTGFFIASWF